MAKVTQTSGPSIGQRVAQGIQGAMSGAKMVSDWQQQMELTKAKLDSFEQQRQQQEAQMQAARQQAYESANQQLGNLYFDSALSDDPASSIELKADRLANWQKFTGKPFDLDSAKRTASLLGKTVKPQMQAYNNSVSVLQNPLTSDAAAQEAFKAGKAALENIKSNSSLDLIPLIGSKMDVLDQVAQKRFEARSAQQRADTLAQSRITATQTPKPISGASSELSRRRTVDAFNKDKEVAKYKEQLSMADRVSTLRQEASSNPTAAAAILRALARASGEVGVLTDQDVKAFGGSQAIAARLERTANVAASGKMPEKDLEYIQKLADAMKKSIGGNINKRGKFIAAQQAQVQDQFDEQQLLKLYGVDAAVESTPSSKDAEELMKGLTY